MTREIVNLTASAIVEEIESFLETYSNQSYQQAFTNPDLRQKLITYIMRRFSSCYVVVDKSKQPSISFKSLPFSPEEGLCTEALIHQGIQHILTENVSQVSHQIPQEVKPLAPSHWFG